jgi:hypothetical protein
MNDKFFFPSFLSSSVPSIGRKKNVEKTTAKTAERKKAERTNIEERNTERRNIEGKNIERRNIERSIEMENDRKFVD